MGISRGCSSRDASPRSAAPGDRSEPVEESEQAHHHDYVYALRDEEAYLQGDDDKSQVVEPFDPPSIVCQFCGKTWEQVRGLFEAKRRVRDPNTSALAAVWICNECVARMAQLLAEEPPGPQWLQRWRRWTPGGLTRP
jgi:ClpX C4-type zinc finger